MIRVRGMGASYLNAARRFIDYKCNRGLAAISPSTLELKPSTKIHGYTVNQVVPVPELHLTAIMLTHDTTKAQHLHISRDDADNAFGVAFRTTPMDHTGVPHILEHTALCGSQKFPVRDPFFKMLNRSLSTFMNAMTSSDWTIYPFSTQNLSDYRNLMSVYLDAAFFPKLSEMDFCQEGWRLEHENCEDRNSPIIFKGVVFNEMKGVFSNSQHIFTEKVRNYILPDHTYSVCYGGDPEYIPDLTWHQLKDFHASHYHPSNSRFYTYGNFPLEHHLEYIEENVLKKFSSIESNTRVPLQPKWSKPITKHISCSQDPMAPDPSKQTTVAVSYLLGDITDPFENFTLGLLSSLLVDGEKSPFYQSLLESNIGSDFAPEHGFNGYARESTFSVGLQGIHAEDVKNVESLIQETFLKVHKEGFEPQRIEALLHKIELSQKHQSDKFGLWLGMALMSPWIHEGNPIDGLLVNTLVEKFKKCLEEDSEFLQKKIKKYFMDNCHRLTLTMSPDDSFEEERRKTEKSKLNSVVSGLTDDEKDIIFEKGKTLAQQQMSEQDISCLPTLKVQDIEEHARTYKTEYVYSGNVPLQLSGQPTNGVAYFRAISNTESVSEELKPYLPLFCSIVTSMGAGRMDYKELSQEMDLKTGGMAANIHLADHSSQMGAYEQGILFSSSCLERNVEGMFELWSAIFHELNLSDTNRLKTLILMSATDLANSLSDMGHNFAMLHASSQLSPCAHLHEKMSGMTQVQLMKRVAEMKDLSSVIDKLRDISHTVLTRENLRCCVNATPENLDATSRVAEKFVSKLSHPLSSKPEKIKRPDIYTHDTKFQPKAKQTHFELPFQVNYVGRSVKTVPYNHEDCASLRILASVLTNKYLHREIREKGGAYGGRAVGQPGLFSFFSYRDPNSLQTAETFDKSVEWALEGDYSQQDIDEAKLSIFSKVDSPVPPGSRGNRLFTTGIDDEMFQSHRQQLFKTSKQDLIHATEKYLTRENRISSLSFLGPQNAEIKDSSDWIIKSHT